MGNPRERGLKEKGDRLNLRTEFTEPECDKFRALCNFTNDERKVFDMRVKDNSIVQIGLALNMSESTVNRNIKNIKRKILKGI